MPTTTIEFVPQAWVQDQAITIDPQGRTTFEVPSHVLRGIRPNTADSGALKDHPNAPAWVRAWTGPYYLTWAEEAPA